LTSKGYVGLLVGLAAAAALPLVGGGTAAPAPEPPAEEAPPPSFKPSEQIDVEYSVDFPYDI
jgi:hypothetical protein